MTSPLRTKCSKLKITFGNKNTHIPKCLFLSPIMNYPFFDITSFDHDRQTVYDSSRVVITYRSPVTIFEDNDVLNLANELWKREYKNLYQYMIFSVQMQSNHLVFLPEIICRDNMFAQIREDGEIHHGVQWKSFVICEKRFYISAEDASTLKTNIFVFFRCPEDIGSNYIFEGVDYPGTIKTCVMANNSYETACVQIHSFINDGPPDSDYETSDEDNEEYPDLPRELIERAIAEINNSMDISGGDYY